MHEEGEEELRGARRSKEQRGGARRYEEVRGREEEEKEEEEKARRRRGPEARFQAALPTFFANMVELRTVFKLFVENDADV